MNYIIFIIIAYLIYILWRAGLRDIFLPLYSAKMPKNDRNIANYRKKDLIDDEEQYQALYQELYLTKISSITRTIEVLSSGQKGRMGFINSFGAICNTENAFKDNFQKAGWKVMRGEVDFWQAMFCLSFFTEIFTEAFMEPEPDNRDIPNDMFHGRVFYLNRKDQIDSKYKIINKIPVHKFINLQIDKCDGYPTRLLYYNDGNINIDMISYSKSPIVQEFLKRVNPEIFYKIVYRIAKNPNERRAGLADFVIWNNNELKMIEVKRVKESVRESQKNWIAWMLKENIPIEIVRIKPILNME